MTGYVTGTNNVNPYRLVILAALATTTVYTTNSTNNFVYLSSPSTAAAAAGYMLLSIINIIWMFYYGTTDEVRLHALIDSYSGKKPVPFYSQPSQPLDAVGRQSNPFMNQTLPRHGSLRAGSIAQHQGNNTLQSGYSQTFMAAPLGAFENSSDVNNTPKELGYIKGHESMAETTVSDVPATPTVYPYRARAVYPYKANPSDANEISFEKGEIMEVSDISGKWWQARRTNGQVGICPSNYVVLEKDSPGIL